MTVNAYPRNAGDYDFKDRSAMKLLADGKFPDWWAFIPVAGKETYIKEWNTKPLVRERLIEEYRAKHYYRGLGVVTGEFSGGLVAIDIDGPQADVRYQAVAGDAYEAYGEETTMSTTSGREGRRQVFYRVPAEVVPQLRKVPSIILREDGSWHLGKGDKNRTAKQRGEAEDAYQEVVVRFNDCQSVLPGSPHPVTHRLYQFLNYNNGEVELAPPWLLSLMMQFAAPVQFLSDQDQKALDQELGETVVPSRQIRGWFFREEVQKLLLPRLEELVFNQPVFQEYGWRTREGGENPQRLSGCPWHGGDSGTAFQYAVNTGVWCCHACGIGGDPLDFIHKVRSNDMYASRPMGPDLESYVAELAPALGFTYPDALLTRDVNVREAPLTRLTAIEFFQQAQAILDNAENIEMGHYHLMEMVRDCGMHFVYRTGPQVEAAVERWLVCQQSQELPKDWQRQALGMRNYLIPDFISSPSSILLHARGGMGKTRLAVLIAKIVGRQMPMRVRGLEIAPTLPEGRNNVLWIGNDMSLADYAEYLAQQGIDTEGEDASWFHFRPQWQQSQYRVLVKWLTELRPALVVVDSLSSVSTMIAAKENEREYSNTLYRLARENGSAFPATTFLWIHHNTKDGSTFRGTDTLRNAVHETWELKELTDDERSSYGDGLILAIDKSRSRRAGDRFLLQEDIEEVLSLQDLTPTVQRANNGLGDETPRTLVLGLLKEAQEPMTLKELRRRLNNRVLGARACKPVSRVTVQRWLQGWMASGLVEEGPMRPVGEKGGRPEKTYRVVPPKYDPSDEQNKTFFTEIGSSATDSEDEVLPTPLNKTQMNTTPEDEADHEGVVSPETGETGATLTPVDAVLETHSETGETEVVIISANSEEVGKTPSPETVATAGISEDEVLVMPTGSLVIEEGTLGTSDQSQVPELFDTSWLDALDQQVEDDLA